MREFQCYLMNANDHIVTRRDLQADELEGAITAAFAALDEHQASSLLPAIGIEIWSDGCKLLRATPPAHPDIG